MTKRIATLFILAVISAVSLPAGAAGYSDVAGHWAAPAVDYVGVQRNWLQPAGSLFEPNRLLTRGFLARALVRAFAPSDVDNRKLQFTDLPQSSSWYEYANVAVKLGWLTAPDGAFRVAGSVNKLTMDRAVIKALDIPEIVRGAANIRTADGYRFKRSAYFPYSLLAAELQLHFNYPNEMKRELRATTAVTRADGAFALWRAATAWSGWRGHALEAYKGGIVLPAMTPARRKVVEFAIRYSWAPYVWGGTSAGGFDCSGFVWWSLRKDMAVSVRPYVGWPLAERVSRYMAKSTKTKIWIPSLKPLDLLFWDASGGFTREWSSVNHTGFYLGNGWFIHSSGSRAGVSISKFAGYWKDKYVWGRRIVPSTF